MENLWLKLQEWATFYGLKVIVAILIFILGRWAAKGAQRKDNTWKRNKNTSELTGQAQMALPCKTQMVQRKVSLTVATWIHCRRGSIDGGVK